MRAAVFIVLVLLGVASVALAQDTGSSFGGGSFGGGGGGGGSWGGGGGGGSWGGGSSSSWGGGGGSSSSSWGGSSSSYSGSSSSSGYTGGGGGCRDGDFTFIFFAVVFVALIVVLTNAEKARRSRWNRDRFEEPTYTLGPSPAMISSWQQMDVSVLLIGIDWRARKLVQTELDRLARTGDTKTPAGLARLLHETVVALRRVELAWLYAGAYNAQMMSPERAEQAFRGAASEARSRFKKELIRNADGTTLTRDAGEQKARREEGAGVVVVTLVVAARRELLDVTDVTNAELLRRLLGQLAALQAHELAAMEVIWSPSAEDDRMSSAELEVLYQEMHQIDDETMAGRIFCDHCGGPYAAELGKCAHCGAPTPSAPAAA